MAHEVNVSIFGLKLLRPRSNKHATWTFFHREVLFYLIANRRADVPFKGTDCLRQLFTWLVVC